MKPVKKPRYLTSTEKGKLNGRGVHQKILF